MEEEVINIHFNTPHPHQQRILDSTTRFKVVMAGRRGGKSLIVQQVAITSALEEKLVAYVTPTYQLAKVFFETIVDQLPPAIIESANKSDLYIKLITGGSIRFFTGESPENFRGHKFHLVIIDEAAYIKDFKNTWQRIIRPTLNDYKGRAIFISTPRGKEFFNQLYIKGQNKEDEFESFRFTTYDNPHMPVEDIDLAREDLPEAVFNQEYLAIPSENAANPFGNDNIQKNIIPHLSKLPAVIYGIDLAKSSDYSVIIGLDKQGHMCHYDRFQLDWAQTKDRIRALPKTIYKLVDSTGVGDPIVEELQTENNNLEGFKFTATSKPQLILSLVKSLEEGIIKYTPDVVDELEAFEYTTTSTGHIKYEAMTGFHDDKTIALALAALKHKQKYPQHKKKWSVVVTDM